MDEKKQASNLICKAYAFNWDKNLARESYYHTKLRKQDSFEASCM